MNIKEKIDGIIDKALGMKGDPNEVLSGLIKDSECNEETIKRISEEYNVRSFLDRQKKGEDMEADFPLANSTLITMKSLKDNLKKANHVEVIEEDYYPIGGLEKAASTITLIVERDYSPNNYLWSSEPCNAPIHTECQSYRYNPIPLAMQKCAAYLSEFPEHDSQLISEFRYLCPDSTILKEAGLESGKARMPDRITDKHSDFLAVEKMLEKFASLGLIKSDKEKEKKNKEEKLTPEARKAKHNALKSTYNSHTGKPNNPKGGRLNDINKGILSAYKDQIEAWDAEDEAQKVQPPKQPNESPQDYFNRIYSRNEAEHRNFIARKRQMEKELGEAAVRQTALSNEAKAQEIANFDTNLYKAKAQTGKAQNKDYQKGQQKKEDLAIAKDIFESELANEEDASNLYERKNYGELLKNLRARRGEIAATDERDKLLREIQNNQIQIAPDSLLGQYQFAKKYIDPRLEPVRDALGVGESLQRSILDPFINRVKGFMNSNQENFFEKGRSDIFGADDDRLNYEYMTNTFSLLNNMKVKNNFESLIEHDPSLQGSDPYIMLDTYRAANDIAPTAMKNKEIARSVLRTANSLGTGGIDPETAALLSKLELQYGRIVQARQAGGDYSRIPLGFT